MATVQGRNGGNGQRSFSEFNRTCEATRSGSIKDRVSEPVRISRDVHPSRASTGTPTVAGNAIAESNKNMSSV